MSSGRNLKKIFEKMGGSEKAKPHSTKEGRVASGARKIRRILKKQKPDDYRPLQEPKRLRDQRQIKKGGRANFRGGGRTNLLEELGRVEAEPSNRNRRAEVSRVHRELNKGYKGGKRVGLKHGSRGPHGFGPKPFLNKPGQSQGTHGGAVLKGKKVGIQIK
jgi:hypothetical protein